MKRTTYILLSLLVFISNISYSDISPEYRLDTSKPVSSKMVIFVSPTSKEIKKIKAKAKDLEGFYVAADDLNYYTYKAEEYLDKLKIKHIDTHKKKLTFVINNKATEVDYSKSDETWFILIYNGKDKPTKTYAIEIDEHEALLKQLTEPTSAPAPSPQ